MVFRSRQSLREVTKMRQMVESMSESSFPRMQFP